MRDISFLKHSIPISIPGSSATTTRLARGRSDMNRWANVSVNGALVPSAQVARNPDLRRIRPHTGDHWKTIRTATTKLLASRWDNQELYDGPKRQVPPASRSSRSVGPSSSTTTSTTTTLSARRQSTRVEPESFHLEAPVVVTVATTSSQGVSQQVIDRDEESDTMMFSSTAPSRMIVTPSRITPSGGGDSFLGSGSQLSQLQLSQPSQPERTPRPAKKKRKSGFR